MNLNCKGKLIDLRIPRVMGILNLTPDSFYDGGRYKDEHTVLTQVERMYTAGATFIDIGAYSSRPGAAPVTETEELQRLLPLLEVVVKKFPEVLISIDTFRSKVAIECLERGAALINDIAAGALDSNMMTVIARYQVPYIAMHMKGNPQTMQSKAVYENLIREIRHYFSKKIEEATAHKINNIIIDPGFGFAKTLAHNYTLLNHLDLFHNFNVPLLVGLSRKSMIYKLLQTQPQNALNGTTALHAIALLKGAHILRVHDVAEAMECITLVQALKENGL